MDDKWKWSNFEGYEEIEHINQQMKMQILRKYKTKLK